MKNYFYSHAREGRDYIFGTCKESAIYFYSHAREGRDDSIFNAYIRKYLFLLTRPRGA